MLTGRLLPDCLANTFHWNRTASPIQFTPVQFALCNYMKCRKSLEIIHKGQNYQKDTFLVFPAPKLMPIYYEKLLLYSAWICEDPFTIPIVLSAGLSCDTHANAVIVGSALHFTCGVVFHGYDDSITMGVYAINSMYRPMLQWSWPGGQGSGQTDVVNMRNTTRMSKPIGVFR